MEVVGCDGFADKRGRRRAGIQCCPGRCRGSKHHIDRVIVALEDRRGELPLRELLKLRFNGVVIEEAGACWSG